MRPIKFKAWDKAKKEWIFGWPFHVIGEVALFDLLKQYSLENLNDIEVVQFTGLLDKNAKEIYDGDILAREYFSHWVVCWKDAGFHLYNVCNPQQTFVLFNPWGREVIGNIYENPELLEVKK